MAAWFGFRFGEDEWGDETCFWRYDSTWEEEEDEEEEDGGGDEEGGGEPEGAEAGAGEEPEDAGERAVRSWVRGSLQAQAQPTWYDFLRKLVMGLFNMKSSGRRNWNAARDLQRYRRCYPGLIESENEEEEEMWNLSFYKNEICFLPQGLYIETLLESWWDNYEVLEENHSYIQWLFPLRERGMNLRAKPLTWQEIQAFKKSKEVMQRFVRAYQLMLRFYGIILINQETGEVKRAENWAERFQNLNRFGHNNLRITRILKCLGEMGYEHYQVHLVKFFLTETLVKGTLPNVKSSALDYFLFTIRSRRKRRELVHYAWQHFKPRDRFVWGPHDKLLKYRARSTKERLCQQAEDQQESPGKKCDDSVEEAEKPSVKEDQKAGDAADSQPRVNDENVQEKLSDCVSKGENGEEEGASVTQQEKELNSETEEVQGASVTQQEKELNSETEEVQGASVTQQEKELNSETEEAQGTAENDCTKESKKRKLDASKTDTKKNGALKSPTDIENISRNLGECAIGGEIPSSVPPLQAEEDQEMLKQDSASTKDSTVPEAAGATVKRRKVDKRTRSKPCTLAINLKMGPSASSAKLNNSGANSEAEKGNVSEKNTTVEAAGGEGGGGAGDGPVRPLVGSMLPEAGRTAPVTDGLELSGDEVTAGSDQPYCNSTLLGGTSEVEGVEQHKKVENARGGGQAEVTSKKQVPESLEQNMASTSPEEDSAELAAQKPESSEHAAEPEEEQAAAQ